MKFKDYIEHSSTWDDYGPNSDNVNLITEAGLSRVLNSIDKSESFAIITAYKHEYDKKENIERNRKLRVEFNSRKMGVYQLVGHWRECQDDTVDYNNCPKNKLIDVIERSYLVIKTKNMEDEKFEELISNLVKKFEQNAAIIKINNYYYVIDRNGVKDKIGEKLTLGKMSQAYSQFVKKMNIPFVFEGVEIPSSISGNIMASMCGIKYPANKEKWNDVKSWNDI